MYLYTFSSRGQGAASSASGRGEGGGDVPRHVLQCQRENERFTKLMISLFEHENSDCFLTAKPILSIFCASQGPLPLGLLSSALDMSNETLLFLFDSYVKGMLVVEDDDEQQLVSASSEDIKLLLSSWLCLNEPGRSGNEWWIDISLGHNLLCALYLRFCGNKSVAIEHPWQDYLRAHGPSHLRKSSRALRALTTQIRKIDETANIVGTIPIQLGFVSGLQEFYARRVGLGGRVPAELGQLSQLRVLSMGNNSLCGELPSQVSSLLQVA